MAFQLICIMFFTLFISCQKQNINDLKSPVLIITGQPWLLSGYGYDENNNGIIDDFEDMIKECEKDNTYYFNKDGTGLYLDNEISCGNGIDESAFQWKLTNNNRTIDFSFGMATIQKLNENEFIIYNESKNSSAHHKRFYTILKR